MSQGRHLLAKVAWCATLGQVVLCLLFFGDNAFQVLGIAAASAGCVVLVGIIQFFSGGRISTIRTGCHPPIARERDKKTFASTLNGVGNRFAALHTIVLKRPCT